MNFKRYYWSNLWLKMETARLQVILQHQWSWIKNQLKGVFRLLRNCSILYWIHKQVYQNRQLNNIIHPLVQLVCCLEWRQEIIHQVECKFNALHLKWRSTISVKQWKWLMNNVKTMIVWCYNKNRWRNNQWRCLKRDKFWESHHQEL